MLYAGCADAQLPAYELLVACRLLLRGIGIDDFDGAPADRRIIVVNGRDGGNQNFTGVPVIHADDGNIFRDSKTSFGTVGMLPV